MRPIDYSALRGLKAGAFRRSGWGCSPRSPSWPQRFCSGPGSFLCDHRDEGRPVVPRFDRLGSTFPRRSRCGRSLHRNHGLAQEVRPRYHPKELLGRPARRNRDLDRRLCASRKTVGSHGLVESHVCRRELHLPPSLWSSDGACLPLAYPSKRQDPDSSIGFETARAIKLRTYPTIATVITPIPES